MELIFEAMNYTEFDRRRMAVFQLTYAVADWWESEKATLDEDGGRRMNWATFRRRFLEKYFPTTERNNKRKEFLELT